MKMKDIILATLGVVVVLALVLILAIASYALIDMAFAFGDLYLEIASICFPIVVFGIPTIFVGVRELG